MNDLGGPSNDPHDRVSCDPENGVKCKGCRRAISAVYVGDWQDGEDEEECEE